MKPYVRAQAPLLGSFEASDRLQPAFTPMVFIILGFMSVIMASWGNDMSVIMVALPNLHHGSCNILAFGLLLDFLSSCILVHFGSRWSRVPSAEGTVAHI